MATNSRNSELSEERASETDTLLPLQVQKRYARFQVSRLCLVPCCILSTYHSADHNEYLRGNKKVQKCIYGPKLERFTTKTEANDIYKT